MVDPQQEGEEELEILDEAEEVEDEEEYEERGRECRFCGKVPSCEHLLYDIDTCDGQCVGGALFEKVDTFGKRVAAIFARLATEAGDPELVFWKRGGVQEIWSGCEFDASDGEWQVDVSLLSSSAGFAFLSTLLIDAGAEWFGSSEFDSGMPMHSTVYEYAFADDPAAVIQLALDRLEAAVLSELAGA